MHQCRDDEFTDWNLPYLTTLGRRMVGLEEWPSGQSDDGGSGEEGEEVEKGDEM